MNTNQPMFVAQVWFKAYLSQAVRSSGLEFQFCADVPNTGKAIHAMWQNCKQFGAPFRVFNGANDADKLYFSPEVNLMYRAIHDIDHAVAYEIGRGTTKFEDELYLNCLMAVNAYKFTVKHTSTERALKVFFAVYHDTVGQALYYREHKDFCVDQKANTIRLLNECEGVRAVLSGKIRVAYQVMQAYMVECGL